MSAQIIPIWTGEYVKRMHLFRVKNTDIAKAIGCSAEYVSRILNGRETPTDAEARFNAALDELIAERSTPLSKS